MKRQLSFYYDILLEFDVPVTGHSFALRCIPPSFPGQEISDVSLKLSPDTSWVGQTDAFGNLLQAGRLETPHQEFHYTVQGKATIDPKQRAIEPAQPFYRYPTRYTAMCSAMREWLKEADLPPNEETESLVWSLAELVHGYFTYTPGATGVATTAAEAFAAKKGVCQDYAHVYLALARECGLYARYVNGLPVGEGASHAWCEVHIDGVWTGIDPTRLRWCGRDYIRFNVGRDFSDCPMERGIFFGAASQCQTVFMRVTEQ